MPVPQFIEIDQVVIQTTHVVFVDFRGGDPAIIHLTGGSTLTAEGDAAQGLRRFFLPQPADETEAKT